MAFDGIVTRSIAYELSDILCDGKIEKIYQPGRDELVFAVHTFSGGSFSDRIKIYASCNNDHPGIWITREEYDNPLSPPSFCMLLRKHIQGSRIVSVIQKGCERIIEITFETRDELGSLVTRRLMIEIMGRYSNIILVDDSDGKIMDSLKHVSADESRSRQVLPGRKYSYPPSQCKKPFDRITENDIAGMLDTAEETSDALLQGIQGVSPLLARALCRTSDEAAAIYEELLSVLSRVESRELSPVVYTDEKEQPADFYILPIEEYAGRYRHLSFDTVSETIEWYYLHRSASNRIRQKSSSLSRSVNSSLKKLRLKKQRLSEDLLDAQNSDKYRLYGELLTANLHKFRTGDKKVTLMNYYDQTEVTIPLDERYAPARNAQIYFKKYSKAKRAVSEKRIQLEETDADISYLESVSENIERAGSTDEIDAIREELASSGFVRLREKPGSRSKRSMPQPFSYETSDGMRILAGRNNRENDILTFKTAGRKDIWFHTKDIPGAHVILFTKGKTPSDAAVFEAASIAAFHSSGRTSENVPVDYTEVRHVKKPSGARPGMVIFTDNRTVFVTPRLP